MSKTLYGHHIETIKGKDYILFEDYTELQNKLEKELEELRDIFNYEKDLRIKSEKEINRLNNIIDELENYLKEYSQDLEFRCYANTFLDKLLEEIE